MDADPQFEPAIWCHPRSGLLMAWHHGNSPAGIDRCTVRGLLAINRKSEPQKPAIRLFFILSRPQRRKIKMGQRAPQRLRIIAAVEMLLGDVVERHLLRSHKILKAHLVRLEPRL